MGLVAAMAKAPEKAVTGRDLETDVTRAPAAGG
jgi:hypothetical protein